MIRSSSVATDKKKSTFVMVCLRRILSHFCPKMTLSETEQNKNIYIDILCCEHPQNYFLCIIEKKYLQTLK